MTTSLINILLEPDPMDPIDNKSALVKLGAERATSHYLNQ